MAEDASKLLEEFNKLPEVLKEWDYRNNVKVVIMKDEGKIDPSDSSAIAAHLKCVVISSSGTAYEFEPGDYITAFGSRAMRKFTSVFAPLIGEAATDIAPHLIEFQTARGEFAEKYHIGHPGFKVVRAPIIRKGQAGGGQTTSFEEEVAGR